MPEEIPERDRKIVRRIGDPDILRALDKVRLRISRHADAGEIAFDIGGENRGSGARKPFRENLQAHGFPGAGRAGDESMPVAKRQGQILVNIAFADQNAARLHGRDRRPWGFLERRRGADVAAPYVAIMRQCGIIAPANLGLAERGLILAGVR